MEAVLEPTVVSAVVVTVVSVVMAPVMPTMGSNDALGRFNRHKNCPFRDGR